MTLVPILASLALAAQLIDVPAGITGDWTNPKETVAIRIALCGEALCGRVIWAAQSARDDARRGGTPELVGTEILRGFVADGPNIWRGRVFVPDLGQTARARLRQNGPDEIQVSGCRLVGLVCKSQIWRRAEQRPSGTHLPD